MTLDLAKQLADYAASLKSEDFVVWRMPAWPPGAYAVLIRTRALPDKAEIAYTAEAPRTGMLF